MLSKVRSTCRLPSPVSVLGTEKAARGFIDFIRSSKLSMSIDRNLRSSTDGKGSLASPERSDITPMTNGTCTFFWAPYSSTSYSICTRGARLRAMNFWLLCLATGHLQRTCSRLMCTLRYDTRKLPLLIPDATHVLDRRQGIRRKLREHLQEVSRYQPL